LVININCSPTFFALKEISKDSMHPILTQTICAIEEDKNPKRHGQWKEEKR
jgi:hypothetical protein